MVDTGHVQVCGIAWIHDPESKCIRYLNHNGNHTDGVESWTDDVSNPPGDPYFPDLENDDNEPDTDAPRDPKELEERIAEDYWNDGGKRLPLYRVTMYHPNGLRATIVRADNTHDATNKAVALAHRAGITLADIKRTTVELVGVEDDWTNGWGE